MLIVDAVVDSVNELQPKIFLLKFFSPDIASRIQPGQFLNVKVNDLTFPLLRRPFSVCDVEGDYCSILFNIHGEGTSILAKKQRGETLNIMGPLGNGFHLQDKERAFVIVAGGMGVAPFPYVFRQIGSNCKILSFIGSKNSENLVTYGFTNYFTATEDGSEGFKGNVLQLMREKIDLIPREALILGCGPTPMLKALSEFANQYGFECEISTECAMACGFGICQGCPIESAESPEKFKLVCSDGPVFNSRDVILS